MRAWSHSYRLGLPARGVAIATAAALPLASGLCGAASARLGPAAPASAVRTAASQELTSTASLSAAVDRTTLTVVDPVLLTLELRILARDPSNRPIAADPALSPQPTPGQPLGDLLVSTVRRDPPQLAGDHLLYRWIVTLEPQLPGAATIPEIVASIEPTDEEAIPGPSSSSPRTAATGPIDLTITSVLEAAPHFTPGQLRPPLDAVARPDSRPWPRWLIPIAVVAGAGALGVLGVVAARPTPRRRLRRSFAPQHALARTLADSGRSIDEPGRAMAAADLIRSAAALALGPAARAATPDELARLLTGPAQTSTGSVDSGAITALLHWADARRYGGMSEPVPAIPPLPPLVRHLEHHAMEQLNTGGAKPE